MRILVVEDEHKIAHAIKRGLEQEKMAVDVCYNGREGFGMTTINTYDAIILDRMLPDLEGVEVLKNIRAKNNQTPVIFLTAKDQIEARVEGLDAGADDYLVKPFAFEELLARIRALLRRPKDKLGEQLSYGDLSLDPITYVVTRSSKEIKLTSKEFALLEFLLRNPDRVLTKEMIINHVWNYDADILPNTVEVYIGYLRRKIDQSAKEKLIHTRHGFGYIFGRVKR